MMQAHLDRSIRSCSSSRSSSGALLFKWVSDKKVGDAGERARQIVAGRASVTPRTRAERPTSRPRSWRSRLRGEFEAEARRREREMQQIEQRILTKEEQLGPQARRDRPPA